MAGTAPEDVARGVMTADQIKQLRDIFKAALELPEGTDVTRLEQGKSANWDSLAHVSLIAGMESEFGVSLDTEDALRITSYRDAVDLLEGKGL